jgi:hypothetical protein
VRGRTIKCRNDESELSGRSLEGFRRVQNGFNGRKLRMRIGVDAEIIMKATNWFLMIVVVT